MRILYPEINLGFHWTATDVIEPRLSVKDFPCSFLNILARKSGFKVPMNVCST